MNTKKLSGNAGGFLRMYVGLRAASISAGVCVAVCTSLWGGGGGEGICRGWVCARCLTGVRG